MQRGRRIAFDYGDVRIGVALSDADAILASPLITLAAGDKNLATTISEIFSEYQPIAIYIGRPSNMDGTLGTAAVKASDFAALLSTISSAPIIEIDERLSTVSAARSLRDAGINTKDAKSRIDQMAAVAILEFALAIEKNSP
jgi:putative holliday junction resolvase